MFSERIREKERKKKEEKKKKRIFFLFSSFRSSFSTTGPPLHHPPITAILLLLHQVILLISISFDYFFSFSFISRGSYCSFLSFHLTLFFLVISPFSLTHLLVSATTSSAFLFCFFSNYFFHLIFFFCHFRMSRLREIPVVYGPTREPAKP